MNPLPDNNEPEPDPPTKCSVRNKNTGKRFPLVPVHLYYEPEIGKHIWQLGLHPDVDGDVIMSAHDMEMNFEIDAEITAVVLKAEVVQDEPPVLRIVTHAEISP